MRFANLAHTRLFLLIVLIALAAAGPSASTDLPKVSAFAPAEDLLEQVRFFVGRVEESLADADDFDLAKQSRTFKDGNTIAALALVLAVHDQAYPQKSAMPAVLRAAQSLATVEDNHPRAKKALTEIKAALAAEGMAEAAVRWEKVASLAALMKQVPLIHSGLKRGVEGNRLARQAPRSAGQAAALAAIAQVSALDPEYVKTAGDAETWHACCVEMRDAAGEVNSAVHAKDEARVSGSMKRLAVSCDRCHAAFRRAP